MEALNKIDLKNILTMDIETARVVDELELDSPLFDAWEYSKRKGDKSITDKDLQELFKDKAALEAEFARIVCISVGVIRGDKLVTRTYNDSDEKSLLLNFNNDLGQMTAANPKFIFAGHHIIGFDLPFIFKRCLINGVIPHSLVDNSNAKPWEVKSLDTAVLWKTTGFNHTSLLSLATCLGLPSPKSDISGADVGKVFYEEGEAGVARISKYCERDILTVANVLRRWKFQPLLELESSEKVEVEKVPLIIALSNGAGCEKREKAELEQILVTLEDSELEPAFTVLDAIAAKKSTKLTATYVKSLRKKYNVK